MSATDIFPNVFVVDDDGIQVALLSPLLQRAGFASPAVVSAFRRTCGPLTVTLRSRPRS
jgi:hypothetical protein